MVKSLERELPPLHRMASEILEEVRDCYPQELERMATGRFLQHWERQSELLASLDLSRLRIVRWGEGWARLEAPQPDEVNFDSKQAGRVECRIVLRDGVWKLEDLKVETKKAVGRDGSASNEW